MWWQVVEDYKPDDFVVPKVPKPIPLPSIPSSPLAPPVSPLSPPTSPLAPPSPLQPLPRSGVGDVAARELKTRALRYLDKLESAINGTTDFVVDQAPDVAAQYIRWIIVRDAIALAALLFVVTMIIWWLARYIRRHGPVSTMSPNDFAPIPFAVIVLIATLGISLVPGIDLLKTSVAPKIVLLEKIEDIARGIGQ